MRVRAILALRVALVLLLIGTRARRSGRRGFQRFVGQVAFPDGHQASFDDVEGTLIGHTAVYTAAVGPDGVFSFAELASDEYQIQVGKPGYRSPATRSFKVGDDGAISPVSRLFLLEPLPSDVWVFHWQTDSTESGQEYASQASPIQPIKAVLLDEDESLADGSAATRRLHDYNVILVNEAGSLWSSEHASRFLITMQAIPQQIRNPLLCAIPPGQSLVYRQRPYCGRH